MPSISSELAEALSTVQRPGDFFTAGSVEIAAPGLQVEGIGPIALPLLPAQAQQLVAIADRAPYGRGQSTLIDPAVRRCWQIGPDRVRIDGRHWGRALGEILARVSQGLGVAEPVNAEFYKLLIYDEGSFFVSHRDTEKSPGMFATLVVVLPSVSSGGHLIVRQKDREVRLDLQCDDPAEAAYAAFYADCVHEVLPVTAGCRLALVYNLTRQGKGPALEPPNYTDEQTRILALLKDWVASKDSAGNESPVKLICLLDHAYSPAELAFTTLKGIDAAAAGVLTAAARQSNCDLHLALLSIKESGIAEHAGSYNWRGRRWEQEEEDEFEVVEVSERYVTLSEWRRPDGTTVEIGPIPAEDDEFSPPDALDELEPDDQHFHEATGNEGASFERTYHRAALVLWPHEQILAVLNQAGLTATLPYLDDLTVRWDNSGEGAESPIWRQAHELSGYMVSTWPGQHWYRGDHQTPSRISHMLDLLTRLEDTRRIDEFLSRIAAHGFGNKHDNPAIIGALGLLSARRRLQLIEAMIGTGIAGAFAVCSDLLARAAVAFPDRRHDLVASASKLIAGLPGDPARTAPHDPWRRDRGTTPDFIVDLFTALQQIDPILAARAAEYVLLWPGSFDLDRVVGPAVQKLITSSAAATAEPVQRLRTACRVHLQARIAEPLAPPADWTRPARLICSCDRCTELHRFLVHPGMKVWRFRAAQPDRSHIEDAIRQARCDLDTTTDRVGRPYTLVCTKNQASYERRMTQRAQDLADLKALDGDIK